MEGPKPNKRRKKNQQQPSYQNLNPFKVEQKKYKLYQHKETDFSEVFEPQKYQNVNGFQIFRFKWPSGTYIVRNFNRPQKVMQIGLYGLNTYCEKPYRTNLDSINELYKQKKQEHGELKEPEQSIKQYLKEQSEKQSIQDTQNQIKQKGYCFNDKIRWSNIGFQYDWSQRKYPSNKTQMHKSIAEMSKKANDLYNSIRGTNFKYEAESAIINYYGQKDYMTGHLDDAQIDQISPIYSFSFGLSCIFLIGGPTKDQRPLSIRLNSGDLLIMAQDARNSYHGVPRIIKNSFEILNQPQKLHIEIQKGKNSKKQVWNYFKEHRININIRQVYPRETNNIQKLNNE